MVRAEFWLFVHCKRRAPTAQIRVLTSSEPECLSCLSAARVAHVVCAAPMAHLTLAFLVCACQNNIFVLTTGHLMVDLFSGYLRDRMTSFTLSKGNPRIAARNKFPKTTAVIQTLSISSSTTRTDLRAKLRKSHRN